MAEVKLVAGAPTKRGNTGGGPHQNCSEQYVLPV